MASTSTLSPPLRGKAAGTTTTRGNHHDQLEADPSTWEIRHIRIRCTCRPGGTWSLGSWLIMRAFGRCIAIFCGIREVEWLWRFRCWGMSIEVLVVRGLGRAQSSFVWLRTSGKIPMCPFLLNPYQRLRPPFSAAQFLLYSLGTSPVRPSNSYPTPQSSRLGLLWRLAPVKPSPSPP